MTETVTVSIDIMSPEELQATAKQLAGKVDRHWTRMSAIIGRVDDEELYGTKEMGAHASSLAWSKQELGITRSEHFAFLALWKMTQKAGTAVAPSEWREISRSKVNALRKVLSLGADPAEWVQKAIEAKTVAEFEQQVAAKLQEEAWGAFRVRAPMDTITKLFEPAMVLAIPEATGDPNTDAEKAKEKDTAFRCLEIIMASYVAQKAGEDKASA